MAAKTDKHKAIALLISLRAGIHAFVNHLIT